MYVRYKCAPGQTHMRTALSFDLQQEFLSGIIVLHSAVIEVFLLMTAVTEYILISRTGDVLYSPHTVCVGTTIPLTSVCLGKICNKIVTQDIVVVNICHYTKGSDPMNYNFSKR